MKIQPSICLDDRKTTKKPQSGWLAPGFEPPRDLPNASLVRYHGATSLGNIINIVSYNKYLNRNNSYSLKNNIF